MNNNEWFHFCVNLMGYDLYKNGEYIPKYIVYWSGYNSEKILSGKSRIKAIPK